ncbi:hypothetical protein [Polaribacter gochangensis]|uniref:hypothetical protein n=1 Tax=Polaribacter gochangensis TaxID=3252903 RepID=UPI0039048C91
MKKYLHFWGLALLIICYSFSKGITHTNATNIKHNEVSSFSKEKPSSVVSVFSYAIQVSEVTINQSGGNLYTPTSEEQTAKPFATNKSLEQFIQFQFYQYTNTAKNFLFQQRKSDLIFPFHYHW